MSSLYGDASRFGGIQYAVVDAWRDGVPIANDLAITAGSVTDDSSPGIRRTLALEIFPRLGLWDLLAPIGTELRPRSIIRYPSGATETVPMGVFDVDGQSMSYGAGGTIKLTGSDKWVKIQRARFIKPQASIRGEFVTHQIAALIRGALGASEPVWITATSTAKVGAIVWERDRDKAIEELAKSIGAYVSFDRNGLATIQDFPTSSPTAVWTVDAGEAGVMLDAQRDRDRKRTYNVVVVASDKADGEAPFAPQVIWDNDPSSPTFAGTDPVSAPGTAGAFGVVPYFYTSPLLRTASQALNSGRVILARTTGLAAQLGMSAVRNHALDSLDAIDVVLPGERPAFAQPTSDGGFGLSAFGTGRFGGVRDIADLAEQPIERHIIDRVTHPLLPTDAQDIDTRSTRTDEFA